MTRYRRGGGGERSPWYRAAFGPLVDVVYAHRDRVDAAKLVSGLTGSLGPGLGLGAPVGRPPRVLDAGCGAGRHLAALAAAGVAPIGVDRAPERLAAARRRGVATPLVLADLVRLPLASGRLDGVFSLFSSFGYLPGGGDRSVLAEFRRVLRPGGLLVLDLADPADVARGLVARSRRQIGGLTVDERRRIGPGPLVVKQVRIARGADRVAAWTERLRLYDVDEVQGLLRATGFERVVRLPAAADPADRGGRLVVSARAKGGPDPV